MNDIEVLQFDMLIGHTGAEPYAKTSIRHILRELHTGHITFLYNLRTI